MENIKSIFVDKRNNFSFVEYNQKKQKLLSIFMIEASSSAQIIPIIIDQTNDNVSLLIDIIGVFSTILLAILGFLTFNSWKLKKEADKYLKDIEKTKELLVDVQKFANDSIHQMKKRDDQFKKFLDKYSDHLNEHEKNLKKRHEGISEMHDKLDQINEETRKNLNLIMNSQSKR